MLIVGWIIAMDRQRLPTSGAEPEAWSYFAPNAPGSAWCFTAVELVALQFAAPSMVSAEEMIPAGTESAEGKMIIVTGTRDARRTQFDTLAPIDVLSGSAEWRAS